MNRSEPRCIPYEVLLSTWIDDQLSHVEQGELLDHLVRCEDCRRFYLEARALQGTVAAVHGATGVRAPADSTWERIEREIGCEKPPARTRVPAWTWKAAALLLLAITAAFAGWSTLSLREGLPQVIEVRLGEDGDKMTDARFLELATELMRSDRRYRSAMLQVMRDVVEKTEPREGDLDRPPSETEDRDAGESVLLTRQPV